MPKRIQRKRTKGYRLPENCVYVGRPTLLGNPWRGPDAVTAYRRFVEHVKSGVFCREVIEHGLDVRVVHGAPLERWREVRSMLMSGVGLTDKDLACWCPLDRACHADVLLELANQ